MTFNRSNTSMILKIIFYCFLLIRNRLLPKLTYNLVKEKSFY
uniref:Uncharacterized protein n=1 Tax=Phyllymenia taiwanensis TaxID=1260292 RepID=R9XYC8_9FLOR|nr:hypothetical protein [Grateloupia taiwanensis]AGO19785.1 hypothetical protein [Grateloupia taiwanensis]